MRKLGIAIVGTGMIGAVHRRAALLAGAEVRGVAASSPQRAEEVAQAWNVPRGYRDIEEVVTDPQVQVVHICTPNHLHRPMAQAALEAGKHVICEKPLATTLEDAEAWRHWPPRPGWSPRCPSFTATTRWSARHAHASRRASWGRCT